MWPDIFSDCLLCVTYVLPAVRGGLCITQSEKVAVARPALQQVGARG